MQSYFGASDHLSRHLKRIHCTYTDPENQIALYGANLSLTDASLLSMYVLTVGVLWEFMSCRRLEL